MNASRLTERARTVLFGIVRSIVSLTRLPQVLIASSLVLVVFFSTATFVWHGSAALSRGTVFRLGDRVVDVKELNEEINTLRALYGVEPATDPTALATFRRDAAKAYAVALILDNAASVRNIESADKAAQNILSQLIVRQLGEGSTARQQFIEALRRAGSSERDILVEIKRQLNVSQLMDRVAASPPASDEEVRRAFDERRTRLGTPERRRLANIVVSDKQTAEQVVARIRSGASFADVARLTSLDQSTRNGGEIGELSGAQLEKNYASAAFSAAPGTIFGPVQTQHGWNIGTVLQILPATPAAFDQVCEKLRAELGIEKRTRLWHDWLASTIVDANVQYADEFRPAEPDAPPDSAPEPQPGADAPEVPR